MAAKKTEAVEQETVKAPATKKVATKKAATESKAKTVKKTAAKKAKKTSPKKPGRKPWVPDQITLKTIEDQSGNGLTDKQIAGLVGVSHQTFCSKKNELPELVAALDRGRAKGVSMAAIALWKAIASGDRQAAQFYLERKGGWKEQTESTNLNLNAEAKDKEAIDSMIDAIAKVRSVARK